MRKFLLFLIIHLFISRVYAATFVHIPDPAFRNYISTLAPAAIVGDSMDIANPVVKTIDSINITGLGISDLTGIHYFDSLHILEAGYNNIAEVGVLPARIKLRADGRVNLTHNLITRIGNTANAALMSVFNLDVSYNLISGSFFYNSGVRWMRINISHNQITSFIFNAQLLIYQDCSFNQLIGVQWTGTPGAAFEYLDCSHNQLSTEFAINSLVTTGLKYLNCSHNLLAAIRPLPADLQQLDCGNNVFETVPVLNASLQVLYIDSNRLLYGNSFPAGLNELYCEGNEMIRIDDLPANLQLLYCRHNALQCLPPLPASLNQLFASQNFITCLPNVPPSPGFTADVAFNGTTYDTCDISATCDAHTTISGYLYFDLNGNGDKDPLEPPLPNHMVREPHLNLLAITDSSGFYSFYGYANIQQTVTPFAYNGATITPDSTVIRQNTLNADTANVNFGYTFLPDDTFSDIRVYITQVIPAVAGDTARYFVMVQNKGNRVETGNVRFIFDALFTHAFSVPTGNLSGDTVNWGFANFHPGAQLNYEVTLLTDGNAVFNQSYTHTAVASIINTDSVPSNNIAILTGVVKNDYPRNTKSVIPQTYTAANLLAGDYFDYTLNFQNTGNHSATHVWIIDSLHRYFDLNTLVIIGASHPCTAAISGNELRVDFNPILLPDTAKSETDSHGFLRFKVKLLDTLIYVGRISNTAYIYFDTAAGVTCGPCVNDVCVTQMDISGDWGNYIITCSDTTKGYAFIEAYEGLAPYSYLWSTGEDSVQTIADLYPGYYYVTVTDQCLSTAVHTYLIDSFVDESIHISILGMDASCGNTGSASVSACGGVGQLHYEWSTGETSETIENLTEGYYTCTVTDDDGNMAVDGIDITGLSSLAFYVYTDYCGTYASAVVQGGMEPYTYAWSSGDVTESVQSLPYGEHSCTVTDINGCSATETFFMVTLAETHFTMVTIDSVSCYGQYDGQVEYSIDGNFDWVYLSGSWGWGKDDTVFFDSWSSGTFPNLGPGIWHLSAGFDGSGCSIDTFIDLGDWSQADIDYEITDASCYGKADGEVRFYNPSTGGDWFVYTGLRGGYHNFTVYADQCPYRFDSIFIAEPDSFVVYLFVDDCGEIAEITGVAGGSEPYSYEWSSGETDSYVMSPPSGQNSYTVTDMDGCTGTGTFTVQSLSDTYFTFIKADSVSCGELSDGKIHYQISNVVDHVTLYGEWGMDDTLFTSNLSWGTFSNLWPGDWKLSIALEDKSCVIDTVIHVSEHPSININYTVKDISCYGKNDGEVHFQNASTGDEIAAYTNQPAGFRSFTVSYANYCPHYFDSIEITEPGTLTINLAVDKCLGDADVANATGGTGDYTPAWSTGSSSVSVSGLPAGAYTVTITDENQCRDSASFGIPDTLSIQVVLQDAALCSMNDGSITIHSLTGGTPPYHLEWSNGDSTMLIDQLQAGNYYLTVTDSSGCQSNYSYLIDCTNAIDGISDDGFELYPNPATEKIYVKTGTIEIYMLEIQDITGRVIQRATFNQSLLLDVSHLPRGVYTVICSTVNRPVPTVKKLILD